MKSAIIVDLDGTLCNIEHRRHFVEGKKKDWPAFYKGCVDDTVNKWCSGLMLHTHGDLYNHIILVTGRPFDYYQETSNWLCKNEIDFDHLFMRKSGDYRKDSVIKKEIYEIKIKPFWDVMFCIDDRQQVVDMWRSLGLTCLQCDVGDF